MKWYHGSPNKFTEFDPDRIGLNGTAEGIGYYFTDKKRIAEAYGEEGYLYTAKIAGKKPLSSVEKTITTKELEWILSRLDEELEYLSNYGEVAYSGREQIMREAISAEYNYNDTDAEILESMYANSGQDPIVIKLFHEGLGYDHIEPTQESEWGEDQKILIALTNDIIKFERIEEL